MDGDPNPFSKLIIAVSKLLPQSNGEKHVRIHPQLVLIKVNKI
jgi:hypothetical protein